MDGQWCTEDNGLEEHILSAFKNLLMENGDSQSCGIGLSFDRLKADNKTWLEIPFLEDEVFSALSNLSGDKAPRLLAITMEVWQQS